MIRLGRVGWIAAGVVVLGLRGFGQEGAPVAPAVSPAAPQQGAPVAPQQGEQGATQQGAQKTAPVTAGPGAGSYSISVRSQIVVLDVVVNDKKGGTVDNLTKGDFRVYEDKVPQEVVSFEHTAPVERSGGTAGLQVGSTEELDRRAPNAPVSIIVLDELTTKFEDEAFARYSLKKYLGTEGEVLRQPTMLMAVGYNQMMVLRDYTTSRKELLAALDKHYATYNWRATNGSWKGEQFAGSFAALESVAKATAGHPGHKNMIWIGRGFPSIRMDLLPPETADKLNDAIAVCTSLLRDARVTLYSVDPAGISAEPPAVDQDGFYVDDPFGGNVTFDSMVTATGGQAFHGRNDVDHLIGTSMRDGESFYTLSYKPRETEENPKAFRKIQVMVNDRSLRATTREGWFVKPPEVAPVKDAKGNVSKGLIVDMSEAGAGLMVFDGVPFTIVRDKASPDKFNLLLKASALEWKGLEEQAPEAEVTLLVESFDRKGKLLEHSARIVKLTVPADKISGIAVGLVGLTTTVGTQAPAARLRFVVRSNGNGKIGADNVFLVDRKTLADPATGLTAEKVRR